MPMGMETGGEKRQEPCGNTRSPTLEQRLLLVDFRQSAFQIVDTLLKTLIVQTQKIEAIQQLFALDVRPIQRALQSGQLKLRLSPIIEPGTHAYASVDRHPAVLRRIVAHSPFIAERLVNNRQRHAWRRQ